MTARCLLPWSDLFERHRTNDNHRLGKNALVFRSGDRKGFLGLLNFGLPISQVALATVLHF